MSGWWSHTPEPKYEDEHSWSGANQTQTIPQNAPSDIKTFTTHEDKSKRDLLS